MHFSGNKKIWVELPLNAPMGMGLIGFYR